MIYVLLMYEWISMIYIILTQRDRNPEEILFDYNNENMDETEDIVKRNQCDNTKSFEKRKKGKAKIIPNNYRKNEIKLEKLYKLFFYVNLVWFVIVIIYLLKTD